MTTLIEFFYMGREANMKLNLKRKVVELGTTHTTLRRKILEIFAFFNFHDSFSKIEIFEAILIKFE